MTDTALPENPATDDVLDDGWDYERIEFAGDNLAVRVPTPQALTAFQLATSKFMDPDTRNNAVGLFIKRHLGPQSHWHVIARMMDGDDPDYTQATIGELMTEIVALIPSDAVAQAGEPDEPAAEGAKKKKA